MAGRHTLKKVNESASRVPVRVSPLSNWAIEYLRHLEAGAEPRLDHRARITVQGNKHEVSGSSVIGLIRRSFSRSRKLGLVAALFALSCTIGLALNMSGSTKQVASKQVGPNQDRQPPCSLVLSIEAEEVGDVTWLGFGGLEIANLISPCDQKSYRVVRDASTGRILKFDQVAIGG